MLSELSAKFQDWKKEPSFRGEFFGHKQTEYIEFSSHRAQASTMLRDLHICSGNSSGGTTQNYR